ncbi:DUF1697 domain-containing protein [Bacillus xiapuensis]|uniref:DUF1697 domain-containing protein n=1 Tax=Bacillus xiapuensis TaxID=2014075 RepID=A0ABU6NCY0_9BACI|nr:DUF1697 domain-containing protein [Bacillus xiapuensis]
MIYIALLRGINVGGHNKIKMADLKKMLETIGLKNVKTYIQSGNVLFESEEIAADLTRKIEEAIQKEFGFPVTVVLRTAPELEQIIKKCPYSLDDLFEGESVHVAFLAGIPTDEGINYLQNFNKGNDEYHIEGQDVYLYFRQSIRDSKLAAQLPKLGVQATVRNWKTVKNLDSMVKEMEKA